MNKKLCLIISLTILLIIPLNHTQTLAANHKLDFNFKSVITENDLNSLYEFNDQLTNKNTYYMALVGTKETIIEEGFLSFSWNSISGATYYKFKIRNVSKGGNWSSLIKTTGRSVTLTGTGLIPGDAYQVWLGAYDKNDTLITSSTGTKEAKRVPYIVSSYNIEEFINTTDKTLSVTQKNVLRTKINEYQTDPLIKANYVDKGSLNPLVMFFEGATDENEEYHQTSNYPYHTEGRYQAMAVVIRNKKIIDVFTNTSTMPDSPEYSQIATSKEGVYPFNSGYHAVDTSWGHIALRVNDGTTTPATYGANKQSGTATGINIHMGYNNSSDLPGKMSEGCLIVHKYTDYNDFADAVGYKIPGTTIVEGKYGDYIKVNGYVVIDRSLRPW